MKNYFGFTLTGKKLLPVWLIFYLLFIVPYAILIIKMRNIEPGTAPSGMIFLYFFLLLLIAFFITFYLVKLMIENIQYKDKTVIFKGSFGNFVGLVLKGLVLSIITLGIYIAWFVRDVNRFFINNSVCDHESFNFKGEGSKLFGIIFLAVFLPIIIISITMVRVTGGNPGFYPTSYVYIQQIIMIIIMIPYTYFVYDWIMNIDYKNYKIKWETNPWNSIGKLAKEIFLSIITIGIYYPMALVKLYAYFTQRTVSQSLEITRRFGFDQDNVNDFLFIWGQILISIVTIGIYFPWAMSKIGARILSRTYLE